jgi:hypothetical protein
MIDESGVFSGGERRFLRIAASIADADQPIALGDNIAGLGHAHVALVLSAIAHAAGFHEPYKVPEFDDASGSPRWVERAALYPWPTDNATD